MHGWYDSMGVGGWLLMSVFWVALIGLIVAALWSFLSRDRARGDTVERPEEILDRRLASGEIDAATYEALRGKLREAHLGRG
jgi:putative membrane protein